MNPAARPGRFPRPAASRTARRLATALVVLASFAPPAPAITAPAARDPGNRAAPAETATGAAVRPSPAEPFPEWSAGGFRIGLVVPKGGAFAKAAWDGLLAFARENAFAVGEAVVLREVTNATETEVALSALAAERRDLVIVASGVALSALPRVADKYPAVAFALVGQTLARPNVVSARFAEHEGGYLAGVVAAMSVGKDRSSAPGFLGVVGSEASARILAGFSQGVAAIASGSRVVSESVNPGTGGYGAGRAAAARLFDRGVRVLLVSGEGGDAISGAIAEARERARRGADARVICYGEEDYRAEGSFAPGKSVVIAWIRRRVDMACRDLAVMALRGRLPLGMTLVFGVMNEGIELVPGTDALDDAILAEIARVTKDIRTGRLVVADIPSK